jgi:hypothetical protein
MQLHYQKQQRNFAVEAATAAQSAAAAEAQFIVNIS